MYFYFAERQADEQMELRLDKLQYDPRELIIVKIPLGIPYQTDWTDYERVDGEVEVNGKILKYVKRKVYKGDLILLCIPDNKATHLQSAKENFFSLANELINASSRKTHGGDLPVKMPGVYDDFAYYYHYASPFIICHHYSFPYNNPLFISPPPEMPDKPPETSLFS